MIAKNKIWIRKITAGFFLLLLFSISAIQQSHTHTNNTTAHKLKKDCAKKDAAAVYFKALSESKCFICEYQLTRDVTVSHPVLQLHYAALFNNAVPVNYFIVLSGTHSFFENRGPPLSS